jgi:hypothetical protein
VNSRSFYTKFLKNRSEIMPSMKDEDFKASAIELAEVDTDDISEYVKISENEDEIKFNL